MSFMDRAARTIFLSELISGLGLTFRYMFRQKVTLNYPYEKGPISPRFRIGRMGLGYEADDGLLVIFVQELLSEEEAAQREPAVGRFWASREQMAALSAHIKKLAAAGRPICALCGNPIDPDGHFCPPSNGHASAAILQ